MIRRIDNEENAKDFLVKMQDLTGEDIQILLLWYQVLKKQWEHVERKKNWWKSVKWDPPSYEKWTDGDEKNLQYFKSADMYLDDTVYG